MRKDHGLRVVRLGLIGAGRIGTMHAGNLARQVPGAEFAAVADPREAWPKRLRRSTTRSPRRSTSC